MGLRGGGDLESAIPTTDIKFEAHESEIGISYRYAAPVSRPSAN